jgi:hypothetical protein
MKRKDFLAGFGMGILCVAVFFVGIAIGEILQLKVITQLSALALGALCFIGAVIFFDFGPTAFDFGAVYEGEPNIHNITQMGRGWALSVFLSPFVIVGILLIFRAF